MSKYVKVLYKLPVFPVDDMIERLKDCDKVTLQTQDDPVTATGALCECASGNERSSMVKRNVVTEFVAKMDLFCRRLLKLNPLIELSVYDLHLSWFRWGLFNSWAAAKIKYVAIDMDIQFGAEVRLLHLLHGIEAIDCRYWYGTFVRLSVKRKKELDVRVTGVRTVTLSCLVKFLQNLQREGLFKEVYLYVHCDQLYIDSAVDKELKDLPLLLCQRVFLQPRVLCMEFPSFHPELMEASEVWAKKGRELVTKYLQKVPAGRLEPYPWPIPDQVLGIDGAVIRFVWDKVVEWP